MKRRVVHSAPAMSKQYNRVMAGAAALFRDAKPESVEEIEARLAANVAKVKG